MRLFWVDANKVGGDAGGGEDQVLLVKDTSYYWAARFAYDSLPRGVSFELTARLVIEPGGKGVCRLGTGWVRFRADGDRFREVDRSGVTGAADEPFDPFDLNAGEVES